MKWDLFKNRLKRDAQRQEHEVDVDALWAAMEPQVDALNEDKGRKKRFVFWMFFSGALALGAIWFTLSDIVDRRRLADVVTEEALNEKAKEYKTQENIKSETIDQKNDLALEEIVKNNIEATTAEQKNNTTPSFENKKQKSISDFNENEKKPLLKTKRRTSQKNQDENTTTSKIEKVTKDSNDGKNANTKIVATKVQSDRITISTQEKKAQKSETEKDNSINLNSSRVGETSEGNNDFRSESKTSLDELAIAKDDGSETESDMNSNKENVKENNNPIPKSTTEEDEKVKNNKGGNGNDEDKLVKESKLKFVVEAQGGFSFANRSLAQKSGAESDLFNNRNDYESSLETSHYGFSVGTRYQLGKKKKRELGLTIGLQRTVITERYKYEDTEETYEMVQGVKVRRVNLDGDTIDIMGEVQQTTTNTIDKDIYNRYRLIDVPVIFSYHQYFGKWNAGFEAGVLANLSLKTEGVIPSSAILDDVNIKENQKDVFKSKVGIGYHFGLRIGQSITERLEWNLNPMFRIYPNDFSVSSYELSQKYVLFGANVGLTYRL